jgi:general nucleoside transport system permease protein
MNALWDVLTSGTMYESAFRLGVLLAFAAVGEFVAERAGTLNISVEGMILAGAFSGTMGAHITGSTAFGLVAGCLGGLLIALVQGNMSHRLTANQFVVGLALNVLLVGLTAFLNAELKPEVTRSTAVELPLLSDIPLVGMAFFGQSWPAYLIYPLIPFTWWLLYRTRWGLEVRACGENPQSADVSGIHVNARRRQAVAYAGLTSGLGGAFLVLAQVGTFQADGVAGRGFIAIAAVIFGGWTLKGTLAGAAVFGIADAMRLALPALGYALNPQLLASTPYVMALVTMLFFAHRTRQPTALAQPFVRGLT